MVWMAARRQSGISADPSRAGEKDDLTRLLVRRFQGMMRDGLLFPGAKLPSERDLAEHFGVARSSLRQALKVLEIMGVITQKVGDGSYLNDDASSVLAVPMEFLFLLDDISWEELMEVRLMVEPALAAKAAERATSADIALIRKSLDEFRQSGGDRTRLVAADVRFHHAIFQAARNRLSSRLFHVIHRSMLRMMLVTSRMVDLEHTLAFHKPIAAAIEQRNAALARKLMTDHLTDAAALLRQGQKQQSERVLRRHLRGSASSGKRAAALHPARRAAL
jgi:GntR family transcriptional regulator, transcriptional repressor for pyruvate dehydrogenase complex